MVAIAWLLVISVIGVGASAGVDRDPKIVEGAYFDGSNVKIISPKNEILRFFEFAGDHLHVIGANKNMLPIYAAITKANGGKKIQIKQASNEKFFDNTFEKKKITIANAYDTKCSDDGVHKLIPIKLLSGPVLVHTVASSEKTCVEFFNLLKDQKVHPSFKIDGNFKFVVVDQTPVKDEKEERVFNFYAFDAAGKGTVYKVDINNDTAKAIKLTKEAKSIDLKVAKGDLVDVMIAKGQIVYVNLEAGVDEHKYHLKCHSDNGTSFLPSCGTTVVSSSNQTIIGDPNFNKLAIDEMDIYESSVRKIKHQKVSLVGFALFEVFTFSLGNNLITLLLIITGKMCIVKKKKGLNGGGPKSGKNDDATKTKATIEGN